MAHAVGKVNPSLEWLSQKILLPRFAAYADPKLHVGMVVKAHRVAMAEDHTLVANRE